MGKNCLASPILGLFPQFSKAFYASPYGIGLALIMLISICWIAYRSQIALLMAMIFFTSQIPQIVLGYPQSRYFYFPMFSLYFLFLLFLDEMQERWRIRYFSSIIMVILLCLHLTWTHYRIALWTEASRQAQFIREQVVTLAKDEDKPIILVDLPDRYGPEDMIWLPFIWQCGIVIFPFQFERVNTDNCSHLVSKSGYPILNPSEIMARYPEHAVYQVMHKNPGDYREYQVISFHEKR
jgi:hypothetical protein